MAGHSMVAVLGNAVGDTLFGALRTKLNCGQFQHGSAPAPTQY
jgi:hypothetical protein